MKNSIFKCEITNAKNAKNKEAVSKYAAFLKISALLLYMFFAANHATAQCSPGLSGTITVGTGGNYTTFNNFTTGFFQALAVNGIAGNITVQIISDINEANNYYPLNGLTECGGGPYTITIGPNSTTMRTITTSATAVNPMFEFDGGQYITIDGSYNGDGLRHLTFRQNDTTYYVPQPSTFLFGLFGTVHDITIQNCIIEGSNTLSLSASNYTGAGVISFGGNSGSGTTMYNIIINNNQIRNNSTASQKQSLSPAALIVLGTAGGNDMTRHDIAITNNQLFNFQTAAIYGVNYTDGFVVASIGNNITITGNQIYQPITYSTAATAIYLDDDGYSHGHTISNNLIGGNAAPVSGAIQGTWTNTAAGLNEGIYLNTGTNSGSTAAIINGNIISNITAPSGEITGIYVNGGAVSIDNNVIGSKTATQNLQAGAASGYVYGIYNTSSSSPDTISNNTVGGLYESNATSSVIGITQTAGAVNITGDTVVNLSCATTSGGSTAYAVGISATVTTGTSNAISGNTIERIGNSSTGTLSRADASIGLLLNSSSGYTCAVSANLLSEFYHEAVGGACYGMQIKGTGNWNVYNNMVNMFDRDYNNFVQTVRTQWFGIYDVSTGGADNYYYNSVLLQGTEAAGGAGNLSSYCFYSNPNGNSSARGGTCNVYNNIFMQSMYPVPYSTTYYYAMGNLASTPATGWNSDYNFMSNVDAATNYPLVLWGSTQYATLSAFQSGTSNAYDTHDPIVGTGIYSDSTSGQIPAPKNNSVNGFANPYDLFVDPKDSLFPTQVFKILLTGSAPYLPYNYVVALGTPAPVITTVDYYGTTRSSTTPWIGAYEFVVCSAPAITLGSNPTVCTGTTSANLTYSAVTNSPNQYSIVWSNAATTAGFANVTDSFSVSPIVLTVPASAAAATYSATLTVVNSSMPTCVSTNYNISVTVSPNNTLTWSTGSTAQTACINTAITSIIYNTGGETGANVTGLPSGVTGMWNNPGVTISGTPTDSGNYTYTVSLSGGCGNPTTATGTITVYPPPTTPVIKQSGDSLLCTISPDYTSYQWLYNDTIISGATNTFYIADKNGNYAVKVTNEYGCYIASAISVVLTGIQSSAVYPVHTGFTVYPNPVEDKLNVICYTLYGRVALSIYNVLGQVYQQSSIFNLQSSIVIDVSPFPSGVYFVKMTSENGTQVKKFIKE